MLRINLACAIPGKSQRGKTDLEPIRITHVTLSEERATLAPALQVQVRVPFLARETRFPLGAFGLRMTVIRIGT